MYSCVYFSEQPQVAVGLGAGGGQASPVLRARSSLVLSPSLLATGRHEHTWGRRGTTLWVSLLQVPHHPP